MIISRQIEFPNKWANIAREVVGRYVIAAVAIIGFIGRLLGGRGRGCWWG